MIIDMQLLYIITFIIYLEGILSIDNAAVLGAMVSVLPPDEAIPWPRALGFLRQPAQRLLGGQRSAALKVGLLGAYLGRGLMLLLASVIIQNTWLRIIGGLYLIKLAFENLGEREPGEARPSNENRIARKSFWRVVLAVELADLAFSLDNVVTVVVLSKELWVIMLGVAMGILTMRFAAGIFARLVMRMPVLKTAAYLLVLTVGAELLVEEFGIMDVTNDQTLTISISTLIFAVLYERIEFLHILSPVLCLLAHGISIVNQAVDWLLRPALWLIHVMVMPIITLGKWLSEFFMGRDVTDDPLETSAKDSSDAKQEIKIRVSK